MAGGGISILIIEDDASLAKVLGEGLQEAGYQCVHASSLAEAGRRLSGDKPDLVLLDMGLPDGNGSDLLDSLRQTDPHMPVIITTARAGIDDRVNGLERGADDYLVKPYAFEELLARIRTQLRHLSRTRLTQTVGDLTIDLPSRTASRAGRVLDLTPREFDILAYLLSLQGEVATREMLQHEIWNVRSSMTSMDNVIDVHVSRLRQKLDADDRPSLIHTVRGIGFVLKEKL
ncbi:MAG TPA: response regulator transcription factor, partial [Pontiella sp.]|nr:response regulator transcription factor [Pontiella sp.]